MWLQEDYSLRPSPVCKLAQDFVGISVTTVCQFCLAVLMYMGRDILVSHPKLAFLGQNHQLLFSHCCPTDNYSSAQFAAGFQARLGEKMSAPLSLCMTAMFVGLTRTWIPAIAQPAHLP